LNSEVSFGGPSAPSLRQALGGSSFSMTFDISSMTFVISSKALLSQFVTATTPCFYGTDNDASIVVFSLQ